MNKIILDTNAYARLLAGQKKVLDEVSSAEVLFMSIFVLGELYSGFIGGTKNRENRNVLMRFLSKPSVKILNATSETAEVFGSLKNALRQAGTPLPINDVWFAAHAIETGSVIVTYDQHFNKIPGIRLWDHEFGSP
jgi:tRNA(fMet)-specific endonuclease VapC